MHIGTFTHQVNLSDELKHLAISDEESANILADNGSYRQACYFIIQAMEKYIRAKIFTLVNPNIQYFRERNRTHSVEDAVEFLLEIISTDEIVRNQVSKQLKDNVLGDIRYNHLHNNLRYPSYFAKFDSYSILNITKKDFDILSNKLTLLKLFLKDLHRFG